MSRFKGLRIETRLDYVSTLNINDIYLPAAFEIKARFKFSSILC